MSSTTPFLRAGQSTSEQQLAQIGSLWGKQQGGFALLAEHLLDSAAVAEIMWDSFLAPAFRSMLDRVSGGNGRQLFAWLCGIHDVGKAAPCFQCKVPELAEQVQQAGLKWRELLPLEKGVHHSMSGARILRDLLPGAGWSRASAEWVWPLTGGHHGIFPGKDKVRQASLAAIAPSKTWSELQFALLESVARAVGADSLASLEPAARPSRGEQLGLAGFIVMADWIASNDLCRGGERDIERVTMAASRERADRVWRALDLRGGWRSQGPLPPDLMSARFGRKARPVQQAMAEVCETIPAPGIVIVEAGMGEGKTELSLAGAEILAHRFGLDGIFDGMPTQATSDQMFERVNKWRDSRGEDVPVALSHGRRRFNPLWRQIATKVHPAGLDEYGQDNPYGTGPSETQGLVVEWLLGKHRALLTPVCVGTVDNEFHAATRTKYVALRFAGLTGKVVILDEIHAYSLYMREFLYESLRWLGSAGVPVILLTATLPPSFKEGVLRAYLEGRSEGGLAADWRPPRASGYPVITWATTVEGEPVTGSVACESGLPERTVTLEVLPDGENRQPVPLADLLDHELRDGGRVLIVRNTVGRAQETYRELAARFGKDVELLHSRFTAIDRSNRTKAELDRLGPGADGDGGGRHILVATQVAEQSFDIDVDLLITDLAPMDLLLQRIGRMHRRRERDPYRPAPLRVPRVIVTGMTPSADGPPAFPYGVEKIYSPLLLLRTAAMVLEAAADAGWQLPSHIPDLVAAAYTDVPVPGSWREALAEAEESEDKRAKDKTAEARPFLLAREEDRWAKTLDGLHRLKTANLPDDDAVAAVVRDGPPTVEVALLREADGDLVTLSGRRLTRSGALVGDDEAAIEEAAGSVIRLPFQLTDDALTLESPTAFGSDGYLRNMRVLGLDHELKAVVGRANLHYDPRLGLVTEPAGGRND